MHGHLHAEGLAHARGLDARADAAPEGRVEQDHVDRAGGGIGGQLLEVDDDGVGGERHLREVAQRLHLGDAVDGILEPIVREVLDAAGECDRVAERPRRVGVVAHPFAGECVRERPVARELVGGREYAALQLVRAEAVPGLEFARVGDELFRGAHLTRARRRVGVAEEEVARELDGVAQLAAEERVHGHAELLADDVEAGELDRRVQLRAVVVEARRRVADGEAQGLEAEHVVPAQVGLEPGKGPGRVLTATAHLAQPDVAVARFDLDDRAHEPSPVRAVAVAQRCLERHRHRRGADRADRRGGHGAGRERAAKARAQRDRNLTPLPGKW